MNTAFELNLDGLVGPTHNHAGLSLDNIASKSHQAKRSNPKESALEGLQKMKHLADLGLKQAVLPPQERPDIPTLRRLGFSGSDTQVLEKTWRHAPQLLASCASSSSMWAASAATVAPSADTLDGKLHFTPANLASKFHRSLETERVSQVLKAIFNHPSRITHHDPLPSHPTLGDEGAANHMRFCTTQGSPGLHVFVFGSLGPLSLGRQTHEASQAIARINQIREEQVIFVQQNPAAIRAGAFHNDVVAVSHRNFFLFHEDAYLNSKLFEKEVQSKFKRITGEKIIIKKVRAHEVSLKDALQTYLFNSQIVDLPDGTMALIAPSQCQENRSTRSFVKRLLEDDQIPIRRVDYLSLKHSMKNGGGPACLRLRVVLNPSDLSNTPPANSPPVFLTPSLYIQLENWIQKHYRDRLELRDLVDPHLLNEVRTALSELTVILGLDPIQTKVDPPKADRR